jgi:hypothetical protein
MRLQNGQLWPTHIEPRMPSPLIFERIRGTAEALSMIDLSAEQQLESLGSGLAAEAGLGSRGLTLKVCTTRALLLYAVCEWVGGGGTGFDLQL